MRIRYLMHKHKSIKRLSNHYHHARTPAPPSIYHTNTHLAVSSLPCYDSLCEWFQPIRGWSDLSHFPRLVQAIDSTQRRRPMLIPAASRLLTSLAISLHHLLNADGLRGLLEVKRERQNVLSVKVPAIHISVRAPEKICLQLKNMQWEMSPCERIVFVGSIYSIRAS